MSDRIYLPRERGPRAVHPRSGFRFWFFLGIAGAILFASGIIVLLRRQEIKVSHFRIQGIESLDEGAIRASADSFLAGNFALLLPKSSFFLVSADAVSRELEKQFPRIEHAESAKEFPDTLAVTIKERAFWGIFCAISAERGEKDCAYLDMRGYGYEKAPFPSGSLIMLATSDAPLPAIPSQILESSLMDRFRTIRSEGEKIGIRAAEFMLMEKVPSEIRVRTREGFLLILKRDDNFANAFSVLKKVLEKEIGAKQSKLDYVDLRFGNKVFYKYRSMDL